MTLLKCELMRVTSSCHSMGTSRPNPSATPFLSYLVFCFLILPVWDSFSFCLYSWNAKFWRIDHFPCILEYLSSVSLLSTARVCRGCVVGRLMVLDDRWRLPSPMHTAGRLFFYLFFCFITLLVSNDFSFLYVLNIRKFWILNLFHVF